MPRKLTNPQALGRALAMVRVGRGLRQKQLAELAGVDPSLISLVESGLRSPSLDSLKHICVQLGVSVSRVIELQDEFCARRWQP